MDPQGYLLILPAGILWVNICVEYGIYGRHWVDDRYIYTDIYIYTEIYALYIVIYRRVQNEQNEMSCTIMGQNGVTVI